MCKSCKPILGRDSGGTPATLPNKNIGFDKTKYPGYVSGTCDCKCVADKIMRLILGSNANIGSQTTAIQLWKEVAGEISLVGDVTIAFNIINSHIDVNRPIEVGVDYRPGHTGNNDRTTDHWVVITGRGFDNLKGMYYYNYIETARGAGMYNEACSDSNRMYYDDNSSTFIHVEAYRGRTYTITQIRPNK